VVGSSAHAKDTRSVSVGSIPDQHGIFDIGPQTLETFRARIAGAKTALFHGALGALENPAFAGGTRGMLEALSQSAAFGIVTSDSVSALAAASGPELEKQIGFVSTGGAASLVFIEGKQLPGVNALRG
jgi:phosphoglycerate kinase